MNPLDVRTVVLDQLITDGICMAVLVFIWLQNRKHFAGISFWVLDLTFQTLAVLLIFMRGSIPDWISITLSNSLVVAGALMGYLGLERFVGKKSAQFHNYVLLAVFAVAHYYFAFAQPNLAARNLILSLGLLFLCFQCMWLMVWRVEHAKRRMTRVVGFVFGGFCLVSLVRIGIIAISPHPTNDFFQSGLFDTLILLAYQLLLILLTFSLELMINQRLFTEVQIEEEKFSKAFRLSPYAIMLTRITDGQIREVNEGFVAISGYSYDEAIGKTTLELQLWEREKDRATVTKELSKSGSVRGKEFSFRKKSGEVITGLFSAEIIKINDESLILSSINDITDRKQMEDELRFQSTHDSLTGLFNVQYYKVEIERLQKSRRFPISVLVADIDKLKKVNDLLGHNAGDDLLRQAAQIIKSAFRPEDLIARIGGDEYVVVLPDTNTEAALQAVERVKNKLKEHNQGLPPDQMLSLSIGAVCANQNDRLSEIFEQADKAMYQDKMSKFGDILHE
jgi:diguanylate cyclase (GGDEF)-like protein/PAS domain S-box-containing protein